MVMSYNRENQLTPAGDPKYGQLRTVPKVRHGLSIPGDRNAAAQGPVSCLNSIDPSGFRCFSLMSNPLQELLLIHKQEHVVATSTDAGLKSHSLL